MTHAVAVPDLLKTVRARTDALAQARLLYADRLAPDFNSLSFLRTDEIGLSRILAWMLDPKGSHAQGSAFLFAYIKAFAPELCSQDLGDAVVQLEAPCSAGGRLDILVSGPNWCLIVENKPFAGDQPQQLSRYLTTLDAYALGKLVYLAGLPGQTPTPDSIEATKLQQRVADGDLVLSSFPELKDWLDACRGACKAERVRSFIDDLQRHILHKFEGYSDMTEKATVVEAILADEHAFAAGAQVAMAWPSVQSELLSRLERDLEAAATARNWKAGDVHLGPGKNSAFDLMHPSDKGVAFTIQFDSSNYRSFCWGVSLAAPDMIRSTALRETIESSRFGDGEPEGPTPEWAWWRYASISDADLPVPRDWDQPIPWKMIHAGHLTAPIIRLADELFTSLRFR